MQAQQLGRPFIVVLVGLTLIAHPGGAISQWHNFQPEIRDELVDLDVLPGIGGPFGQRVSDPRTNILWADIFEGEAGFGVLVQFVDLAWAPQNGQDVYVGGFVGDEHILLAAIILPSGQSAEFERCNGAVCESRPASLVVDQEADTVRISATWESFGDARTGDVLTRTLASSRELFGSAGGGYSSANILDFAPNRGEHGLGIMIAPFARTNYGLNFTFCGCFPSGA